MCSPAGWGSRDTAGVVARWMPTSTPTGCSTRRAADRLPRVRASLRAGSARRAADAADGARGANQRCRSADRRGAGPGRRRIVVGLGGSATTDGGRGMVEALGGPGAPSERLAGVELIAATDVEHPLLGPRGAARVFGPQKGADDHTVAVLERRLAAWATDLEASAGRRLARPARRGRRRRAWRRAAGARRPAGVRRRGDRRAHSAWRTIWPPPTW